MIINLKNLGDKCREVRVSKKKSQESLALDLNIATSTIARIENNKITPKADKVLRIFEKLGYELHLKKKGDSSQ